MSSTSSRESSKGLIFSNALKTALKYQKSINKFGECEFILRPFGKGIIKKLISHEKEPN